MRTPGPGGLFFRLLLAWPSWVILPVVSTFLNKLPFALPNRTTHLTAHFYVRGAQSTSIVTIQRSYHAVPTDNKSSFKHKMLPLICWLFLLPVSRSRQRRYVCVRGFRRYRRVLRGRGDGGLGGGNGSGGDLKLGAMPAGQRADLHVLQGLALRDAIQVRGHLTLAERWVLVLTPSRCWAGRGRG